MKQYLRRLRYDISIIYVMYVMIRFRETSPCIKGVNWEPMPWFDFQMTITPDLSW